MSRLGQFQLMNKIVGQSLIETLEGISWRCFEQFEKNENTICEVTLHLGDGTALRGAPYKVETSSHGDKTLYLYHFPQHSKGLDFSFVNMRSIAAFTVHEAQTVMTALSKGAVAFDVPPPEMSQLEAARKMEAMKSPIALDIAWDTLGDASTRANLIPFCEALVGTLNKILSDPTGKEALSPFKSVHVANGPEQFAVGKGKLSVTFALNRALPSGLGSYLEDALSRIL